MLLAHPWFLLNQHTQPTPKNPPKTNKFSSNHLNIFFFLIFSHLYPPASKRASKQRKYPKRTTLCPPPQYFHSLVCWPANKKMKIINVLILKSFFDIVFLSIIYECGYKYRATSVVLVTIIVAMSCMITQYIISGCQQSSFCIVWVILLLLIFYSCSFLFASSFIKATACCA